jgi:hypothetical protein
LTVGEMSLTKLSSTSHDCFVALDPMDAKARSS